MKDVWVAGHAIISPLGNSTGENFQNVLAGVSGIKRLNDSSLCDSPIHAGKIAKVNQPKEATRFESLCLEAIAGITNRISLPLKKTVLILSTTKGNIDLLENPRPDSKRIHLHQVADFLSEKSGLKKNIVVSNACISGVMAMIVAKRFLQRGNFDHALIVGADELTHFVITGFKSLSALSDERCKPFDAQRNGINLGEAAAAVLLTADPGALNIQPSVKILGYGLSNDANHISGPSRTGEELAFAINRTLTDSHLKPADIDFISAHGTATVYNDEMEAKAFWAAGFEATPVHSLKGYYGHTLGAAGVVESIIGIESLRNNVIAPTLGFENPGVSKVINVTNRIIHKPVRTFLKTASGFGGCNAAIIFQKKD